MLLWKPTSQEYFEMLQRKGGHLFEIDCKALRRHQRVEDEVEQKRKKLSLSTMEEKERFGYRKF